MNNQKEKVSEHYSTLEIEPFEIIEKDFTLEEQRGYYKGNILKYTLRDKKQNQEDAVKIQVYAEKLEDLELKVKIAESLDTLEENKKKIDEACLLEELVKYLEESIQCRQAIINITGNADVKDAIQYFIGGIRMTLYKIESLKEEYAGLNEWGKPYEED